VTKELPLSNSKAKVSQRILAENNQLVLPVLRTEDMVALLFHFINFKWNTQRKVIERGDGEALISVYFPPQSIVEEAFFISATRQMNLTFQNHYRWSTACQARAA
jgi:hypothetical protein